MNIFLAFERGFPRPCAISLRAVLIVFLVGAASMVTVAAKDMLAGDDPAPPATLPPVLTPEEILRIIPPPTGTSQSEKALAETLGKARQTPQDAIVWVNLGDALAQSLRDTGDRKFYDLAELGYARALRINARSVDAMDGMAWATGGKGASAESLGWAKQALALDPKNAAACGIIGDVALENGNYDEAYDNYQKMMDLKPDLSSWSRGANLLWITGNRTKAIWLMEKAIKAGAPFAENTAWCRAKYAMMLFDDGALVPAAQALEPALVAGSRNPQLLLAAGTIAAARHDFAAATKYYLRVLEKGPDQQALTALGDLCTAKGEKEEAEKYYTQVESLYRASQASGSHDSLPMAMFYADHDRNLNEALRLAQEHKQTGNVLEADALAWIYFKCGDQPHAIEAMKLALSRNTAAAAMQFHAGMIAAAANDRTSAQKHLQAALSYNPHFDLLQAPIAVATLEKLGSVTTPESVPQAPPAKS